MKNSLQTIFQGIGNPEPYELAILSALPTEHVMNIDAEIRKEVVPYLSKLEFLSASLQKEAIQLAQRLSPSEYYDALVSAWKRHNQIAKTIDAFIAPLYTTVSAVETVDFEMMHDLLKEAFAIEHQKRALSAGVKPLLDVWIEWMKHKMALTDSELRAILTVEIPNYWFLYEARHTEFSLAQHEKWPEVGMLHKALLTDFHASNIHVMHGRISAHALSGKNITTEQLLRRIDRFRCIESALRALALEGAYAEIDRPIVKNIRQIIIYDNYFEQSFGYNLFGIPDLFLRKLVINILIKRGLIDKRETVLLYFEDELLKGVKQL